MLKNLFWHEGNVFRLCGLPEADLYPKKTPNQKASGEDVLKAVLVACQF